MDDIMNAHLQTPPVVIRVRWVLAIIGMVLIAVLVALLVFAILNKKHTGKARVLCKTENCSFQDQTSAADKGAVVIVTMAAAGTFVTLVLLIALGAVTIHHS